MGLGPTVCEGLGRGIGGGGDTRSRLSVPGEGGGGAPPPKPTPTSENILAGKQMKFYCLRRGPSKTAGGILRCRKGGRGGLRAFGRPMGQATWV